MYTIKQLGQKYNLSRSTLLYYDKIGLLKPTTRSESNYRLYAPQDIERMNKIATYRNAGLSLKSIADILNSTNTQATVMLEKRLTNLNGEMSKLRQQQKLILELLGCDSLVRNAKAMNKEQWVNILKASGMSDAAMHRWHIEFERDLPEVHSDFLESLGIDAEEIKRIKTWSKTD